MPNVQTRATAMAEAFAKAPLPDGPVLKAAAKAINRGAGCVRERGWNAHLSYRTAQKLRSEGAIP